MDSIPPLDGVAWKSLERIPERGPTELQRRIQREAEEIYEQTRWGNDRGGSGRRPDGAPGMGKSKNKGQHMMMHPERGGQGGPGGGTRVGGPAAPAPGRRRYV